MFAVLILGIGFILVAAIFPVALRQTQMASEETVAATIAKGGFSYLAKYNSQSYWYVNGASAANGLVYPIGPGDYTSDSTVTNVNSTLWPMVCGNFILPGDSRYAWVPMFRQASGQPYVQVILIGVRARNRNVYDNNDLAVRADGAASLEARPLLATFHKGPPDTVDLSSPDNNFVSAAAPGAYLVVSNDSSGQTNGWVYRLGNNAGLNTWQLAPGNDMTGATAQPGADSTVLIVGAGYDNATATTYSGPAQDVGVYTTFIAVH